MRPFDARRLAFETVTGGATTRFCGNTAAAEAATSLEITARSSAPVFFRPQAIAAKRKPRGRQASERACFMSANSRWRVAFVACDLRFAIAAWRSLAVPA